MKNYLIRALIIGLSVLFVASRALASFYPSGGTTYRLQSSIGSTDTSITLSSFYEPVSNIPYTMSYLNSTVECGTLDPQNSNSEFISFTGITQNANGSATLTGVLRGLGRSYPYTASTTLASAHAGGSIFILSDAPCLFAQYTATGNSEAITGSWTVPDPSTPTQIANKEYVDGKSFGGIGGASETATGTVQIATGLQAASSTVNGSSGRLVLPSSLSTSTWSATIPVGTIPVIGTIGGKLDTNFIPTTLASTTVIGSTNALAIGKNEFATTTSGTWTVPSGITKVWVRIVGGGGSGGASSAGQSGGAGGYSEGILSVSGTLSFTIGTGGAASGSGNFNGNSGTATSVGGLTANGGSGGGYCNGTGNATVVPGGTASGGTFNSSGANGNFCVDASSNVLSGQLVPSALGASVGYGSAGGTGASSAAGGPGAMILMY